MSYWAYKDVFISIPWNGDGGVNKLHIPPVKGNLVKNE